MLLTQMSSSHPILNYAIQDQMCVWNVYVDYSNKLLLHLILNYAIQDQMHQEYIRMLLTEICSSPSVLDYAIQDQRCV